MQYTCFWKLLFWERFLVRGFTPVAAGGICGGLWILRVYYASKHRTMSVLYYCA